MTSKFSRFITFMLLGFVVFSTTLVIGSLYQFLSATMQREYQNELKACQAEVAIILQDRFNLLEMQLKEASLNNALRVNLMLGVTQQLEEHLHHLNPLGGSTTFLIQETRTARFIPDLPQPYPALHTALENLGNSSAPQKRKFVALGGSTLSLFAFPINRKNERLGTVFAIYDLSQDDFFWERFHKIRLNQRLLARHSGQLTDLFTQDRFPPLTSANHFDTRTRSLAFVNSELHLENLIAIKDFPDLVLSVSSASLHQRQTALFEMMALIGALVFMATVGLVIVISHAVSKPLKTLVDQALDISKDPADRFLSEDGIKYAEFRKLTASFNLVLENLQAVRKKEEVSKKYLDIILNTLADPVLVKDDHHRLLMVNQAYCDLLGFQRQQVLGKTSYELFPKDEADRFHATDQAVLNTEKEIVFEGRVSDAQGKTYIVSTKKRRFINPETGQKAIVGVMRDITDAKALELELSQHRDHLSELVKARTFELEKANTHLRQQISDRKQIERALRESEERYRGLFENANDLIQSVAPDGSFLFVNPAWLEKLGYTQDDLAHLNIFEIIHPDDLAHCQQLFKTVMQGVSLTDIESVFITRKGESIRVEGNVVPRIVEGKIVASHGFFRDITDRKQAEAALRQSEEKYRTILESMLDGYLEVDLSGNLTFFNEALCKLLGFSAQELSGMNYQDLSDSKTAQEVFKTYNRIYSTGKPLQGFEYPVRTKQGEAITVATSVALIHDNDGKPIGFRGLARDVTEQRRLETRLQQAQRMEAIGTLAGGVAHDLNNILSGLVSYPELLLIDLPADSPLRKPILTIKKSGEKAAAIVQDLLTLARRGVAVKEAVNLNDIITEYLNSPECNQLLAFHRDVRIETDLDADLLNISGSALHLSKTIMNLVSNAAEAMPSGGTITVESTNLYVDRPIRGYDKVQEGDYVVVKVQDTGIGIAAQDLVKIFEPFYTKKVMGRSGTGLGMAVVWGAVKDHYGYIDVLSDQDHGSTFTLYFPATRQVLNRSVAPISMEDYTGQGESILVVDDVAEQRDISSGILQRLGYTVTTVPGGEAAIDYLQHSAVDLVVLDMIMDPGMDGLETFKQMLKIDPRIKAVIASGFSETDRVREALRLGAGPYIKKPYTMAKIGMAVKKALHRPSTSLV